MSLISEIMNGWISGLSDVGLSWNKISWSSQMKLLSSWNSFIILDCSSFVIKISDSNIVVCASDNVGSVFSNWESLNDKLFNDSSIASEVPILLFLQTEKFRSEYCSFENRPMRTHNFYLICWYDIIVFFVCVYLIVTIN